MEINFACMILDRSLREQPDAPAIVGHGFSVSYRTLAAQVDAAAAAFRAAGCVAEDRVLICLPAGVAFSTAFLGALRIGAIPVPVSPYLAADYYDRYVADTTPSLVVALASAAPNIPPGPFLIILDEQSAGECVSWQELVRRPCSRAATTYFKDENALALLLYTSGSTNRQKCAMHSQRGLVAACRNIGAGVFGFSATDRIFSIPKPFFAFGLGFGTVFPLYAGASSIVSSKPADLEEAVELIRELRPTVLCAIPSFLSILLRARSWLSMDLSSLRLVASAGEPLGIQLRESFQNTFKVDVVDGIGSTEMLTHFISSSPHRSVAGSCGTVAPEYEAELVDEYGRAVSNGQIGALRVKGPTSFLGYWRNAEATALVRHGEWLSTGDNLYRDEAGNYFYCGRNDDMLKLAGMWIIPREVEAALCLHPEVSQAFVTTREDQAGRRRLIAYLVRRTAATPTRSELLRFIRSKVSEHMVPAAFVVVDGLPLTSNGKVDRKALPAPDWQLAQSV